MFLKNNMYDYSKINSLMLFDGTHPAVMQKHILSMNWDFEFDVTFKKASLKEKTLEWIEQKTGKRLFEFKNYKLI
jgi:hypothetical protein